MNKYEFAKNLSQVDGQYDWKHLSPKDTQTCKRFNVMVVSCNSGSYVNCAGCHGLSFNANEGDDLRADANDLMMVNSLGFLEYGIFQYLSWMLSFPSRWNEAKKIDFSFEDGKIKSIHSDGCVPIEGKNAIVIQL